MKTGEKRKKEKVIDDMRNTILNIRQIAEEECLNENSLKLINKTMRVLPKMEETLRFVSSYVENKVKEMPLSDLQKNEVSSKLIPAYYLERVGKQKRVTEGGPLLNMADECKRRLFGAEGALGILGEKERINILEQSCELANIFQRSSSCVEGRNGVLSFRNHELKGVHPRKLKVLTALHNYFIEREDGTTAAERFFGNKPSNMFKEILKLTNIPTRPRVRAS